MSIVNKTMKWLGVVSLMCATSCTKYLDRNPMDSVSSQIFWASDADVQSGLAGVYSRLQQNFLGYERVYLDGLTDNAWNDPGNTNQPGMINLALGSISAGLT